MLGGAAQRTQLFWLITAEIFRHSNNMLAFSSGPGPVSMPDDAHEKSSYAGFRPDETLTYHKLYQPTVLNFTLYS